MSSSVFLRTLACASCICILVNAARSADLTPDAARTYIPPNDGFGSFGTSALPQGTIGGSNAAPSRIVTVTNRKELLAALAWPDPTPKLVLVKGTIDMNVDDAGAPLACKDYVRGDPATGERFSLYAFLAMYDPTGPLAKRTPFGGQEYAREASAESQEARIRVRVPPNTTLFGVGTDATLLGAWIDIRPEAESGNQAMNVIVRNLNLYDTIDCFPQWTWNEGLTGGWAAQYDSISVRNATHVWIDHDRFGDVRTLDSAQPDYFGHRYQQRDGQLDITRESDFITVSWNRFTNHDKSVTIGESDESLEDRGKLHVTLHHNFFENVARNAPRVRFGQVHVYDNLYRANSTTDYRASWGVGFESQVYAENNYFELDRIFGSKEVIDGRKGTRLAAVGNCWTEDKTCTDTDFVKLWNTGNTQKMKPDAGWVPSLYGEEKGAEPPAAAREKMLFDSGPRR
jgi:pectate lyase